MSLSDSQVNRMVLAAESISEGLCDLLNAIHRELGEDFQPLYKLADKLSDDLSAVRDRRWPR